MPRETVTRRKWLAALAGGLTAGCGGRSGERAATATATPSATATPPRTTATAASRSTEALEPVDAEGADSFEQGPADCALDTPPIAEGTWPMIHHDPAGTNAAPAGNGPTEFPLNELWTMSALEATVTFPVADNDYVYVVAADADSAPSVPISAVLCHDPRRTGEIQWRYRVDAMPIGPPVVAGDVVYVPFGTREDARVVALHRERGTALASYDLPGRLVGDLATAGPGLMVPTRNSYRVVDARTGESCWSFSPNKVRSSDRQDRQIRAAAVGDGVAYVGTGYPNGTSTGDIGHLYAVDPSIGGIKWHAPLAGPVGRLAVTDDVVVATTGSGVGGFDPGDGTPLWTAPVEGSVRPGTLAVSNGLVVYGTRRTLHGLDLATGTERWSRSFGVRGDVIFVGDILFAVGARNSTGARISLSAIHADSGQHRWKQQLYDPIVDVMAANGDLYAITTDGRLFSFSSI